MDPALEKERRRHARRQIYTAAMVTPNGHRHSARVHDISHGGARLALPQDWSPPEGTALRVFFLLDSDEPMVLRGHVARVAIDHMGVEFEEGQDTAIRDLLELMRMAED